MSKKSQGFLCLILVVLFSYSWDSHAQNDEKFGQNIIQYDQTDWKNFDTSHYRVFFSGKDKNVALMAANMAEDISAKLAKKLKFYIDYKSNLIIFSSYNTFIQSNIHGTNDAIILNYAGKIRLVGKTYMAYYDGKVSVLQNQIREQVIRGAVEEAIYGDDRKNLARSTMSKDIPYWFSEGLIEYLKDSVTLQDINKLESYAARSKKLNIYQMAYENPVLAGKLFWAMVEEKTDADSLFHILNYSVGLKSYNSALKKIMRGREYNGITKEWQSFAQILIDRNQTQKLVDTPESDVALKIDDIGSYSTFSVSPIDDELFYVKHGMNTWQVKSKNSYGRERVVMDGPIYGYGKKRDPINPILAWSHNGQKLGIIYYTRGRYKLRLYDALSREFYIRYLKSKNFERILSASFTESSNYLLMSVIKRGKSDIVLYTLNNKRMQKITDDDFTDIEPIYFYSQYRKGLFWLSNRDSAVITRSSNRDGLFQSEAYNIYYKDQQNLSDSLWQLTHYKNSLVSQLTQFDENSISYMLDSNNRRYQMILKFEKRDNKKDTFRIFELPNSSYPLAQQYIIHTKQIAKIQYENNDILMKKYDPQLLLMDTVYQSLLNQYRSRSDSLSDKKEEEKQVYPDEENNYFMSSFYYEDLRGDLKDYLDIDTLSSFTQRKKRLKITNAEPNVKLNQFGLSLNNELLGSRYQSIDANGVGFSNPPVNEMISVSLSDVMEDYLLSAGFKFNFFEQGSEEYVQFKNQKRRTDWGVTLYRKSNADLNGDGKVVLSYAEPFVSYPFSDLNRAELAIGYRQDKGLRESSSPMELENGQYRNYWLKGKLSYIYDNSYQPETNIHIGQRMKVYSELFENFTDKKTITNFAIDFRDYRRLFKNVIWANRISMAASYGNSRIAYMVGGVQNEVLSTSFTDNFTSQAMNSLNNPFTILDPSMNFVLQTKIAPLRGYKNNVSNGNGYGLFNSEIRMPLYSTLFHRPTSSHLLRSLSLIMFFDAALAWTGNVPEEGNLRNDYYIPPSSPGGVGLTIKNPYLNPPLGFGAGFRGVLLGYYTRIDFAWNNHQFNINPILHISIGTDF